MKDKNSNINIVQNRETNIGDFCADSYRLLTGADIGLEVSDSIQGEIKSGSVTFGDVLSINPYNNSLVKVTATGQDILDALEMSYRLVETASDDGSKAIGTNKGFYNISGMKLVIDTSIPSRVKTDSSGIFQSIEGERRVKDVQVMNKQGVFEPIDAGKNYVVASSNYLLLSAPYGNNVFKNKECIYDNNINKYSSAYQWMMDYIHEKLHDNISAEYAEPQGRIIVK